MWYARCMSTFYEHRLTNYPEFSPVWLLIYEETVKIQATERIRFVSVESFARSIPRLLLPAFRKSLGNTLNCVQNFRAVVSLLSPNRGPSPHFTVKLHYYTL